MFSTCLCVGGIILVPCPHDVITYVEKLHLVDQLFEMREGFQLILESGGRYAHAEWNADVLLCNELQITNYENVVKNAIQRTKVKR
jgi:hypothetical protein